MMKQLKLINYQIKNLMKFITIKLALLLSIILTSCGSDELSKNKAENLIRDCIEKHGKEVIKTQNISFGKMEVLSYMNSRFDSNMEPYIRLRDLGLVTIDTLNTIEGGKQSWGRKVEFFQVDLTPKALKHVVSSDTIDGVITAKFNVFQYDFDGVTEIHEIPEKNIASVKAKVIRTNETPFFSDDYERKNPKEIIRTLTFRKTTDGWKVCD